MEGTISDGVRKRRLPLWMLGVAAAEQVRKTDNGVNDFVIIEEEGIASQCHQTKSKTRRTARHGKEFPLPDKEALEREESSLLVKCETKRNKRKMKRRDASCNGNFQETGREKKRHGTVGRIVRESAPRKRQKAKTPGFESSEEIEVPSPNEDDEDLTMEDLMSIAKEIVKDRSDMGKQQPSDGEHKAESRFAAIAFSRNELGGSMDAPKSNRRSPTRNEIASRLNSAENLTSGGIIGNPSMTGDPTQDMLNLFLGPLLKKPLEEKVELITEDMKFVHEFGKHQNVVIGDEQVPLTKKKSSLKDKVAMFFD